MSLPEDKSERVPVSAPVDQPRERAGLSIGRIINGAILLIHVATFITALCVIGLVGNLMGSIGNVRPATGATLTGTCPFYAKKAVAQPDPKDNYYPLAPNGVCLWFIAGHTIIAIAAIVFFVVGIVRIVFAMNIGFGTIAELIATPILLLLAFAVAVSLSIGIALTCNNVTNTKVPSCGRTGFPKADEPCGSSDQVCWYSAANQAQAAAWIIHIFFIVFFVVNIVRLIIFIRRKKEEKRRRQLLDYDTSEDPPPAPV